jgi:hypothetical protein
MSAMRLRWCASAAGATLLAGLALPATFGSPGASATSAPLPGSAVSVSTPACGKTEFPTSATSTSPGANWVIPGGGVPVRSNGTDEGTASSCTATKSAPDGLTSWVGGVNAGLEWQCVEFINRLYLTRGWITGQKGGTTPAWPGNAGPAFYDNAPSNLSRQRNGSVSYLGPGDVVIINVFHNGHADGGHALVVNDTADVDAGSVSLVSQNSGLGRNSEPVVTGTITNGSITVGGGGNGYTYTTYGVVHSPLAWNAVPISLPAVTSDVLTPLVTCVSPSACVSAIDYEDSSGISHGLFAWGHGSSWKSYPMVLPRGANPAQPVFLTSLACSSASACVATGRYTTKSGHTRFMLVSGSRSSWHAAPVPVLGNGMPGSGEVSSVACVSSSECLVIGSYEVNGSETPPMLLWGYGEKWTPTAVDLPDDANLNSVTCAADGACAAGAYDPSGQIHDVLLTGHDSLLSPYDVSLPPDTGATDPGIVPACESRGHCLAVVNYVSDGNEDHSELLAGYGAKWTAVALPVPAHGKTGSATPLDVVCGSASHCLAVGDYSASGTQEGLLDAWNGSTWAPAEAQVPTTGSAPAVLALAACAPSGLCAAAGYYYSPSSGYQDLLLSGYGTSMTPAAAPAPFGNYPDVDSLSCASSSAESACAMAGAAYGAASDALLWHWG